MNMTTEQYTALKTIAAGINQAIQKYNDEHPILHQLIWAGIGGDEELIYFEIKHFRTHSATEEAELYSAIDAIGQTLRAAGFSEDLRSSGDNSFVTAYTITKP